MTKLFLSNVEVEGHIADVLIDGDRVAGVGRQLVRPPEVEEIDGRGGALIPGLHDHHVHLLALAAQLCSVDLSSKDRRQVSAALAAAEAETRAGEWIRATGYHDQAQGALTRWDLDEMVPSTPVRVQHRSGAAWSLNSAALHAVGLLNGELPPGVETDEAGVPTGRLFRLDEWLRERLPPAPIDLSEVGRRLAAYGVTGVTDATPWTTATPAKLVAEAVRERALSLRVSVMGVTGLDPADIPDPLRVGPAKILLPDHQLPSMADVVDTVRLARSWSRRVAFHCVTRPSLVLALAALRSAGHEAGDRIEHAAIAGPDLFPLIKQARVTVVTQPNFVVERGDDYLLEVSGSERCELWPCRSLIDAEIPVGVGTDAPYGRADPWALMHAAVTRTTASGAEVLPAERVAPSTALGFLLSGPSHPGGPSRRIAPGCPADLCLLHLPLSAALAELPANPVRSTIFDGSIVY